MEYVILEKVYEICLHLQPFAIVKNAEINQNNFRKELPKFREDNLITFWRVVSLLIFSRVEDFTGCHI